MLEIVLEVLGEFLIQVVGEVLLELGLHSLAEPFRKVPNPWLAAFGYAVFGGILGGLSLLAFPHNFVPEPWRLANLIATPLAAGGLMSAMGAWRARRGDAVLRIDKFAYGYLFALALALMRFFLPLDATRGAGAPALQAVGIGIFEKPRLEYQFSTSTLLPGSRIHQER